MSVPVIPVKTREQVINDLLESVALEETALAHIMNAEGEKIQHILGMPNVTPGQIVDINKTVESMLKVVAKKEMLLQFKLEGILEL